MDKYTCGRDVLGLMEQGELSITLELLLTYVNTFIRMDYTTLPKTSTRIRLCSSLFISIFYGKDTINNNKGGIHYRTRSKTNSGTNE